MGIDRLSLSFPITSHESDVTAWTAVGTRHPGTPTAAETRSAHIEDVFVGVQEVPGSAHRWWGKVEANPSRLLDPDGHGLCEVEELPAAVRKMIDAGKCVLQPAVDWREMKPRRVDVTRDFEGVARPASLLVGLQTVHRPWSRKNAVFNDGSRNGAQTLMVGSKAGSVRLYDKHAETNGAVPEGTLRWEAECRSDWLKRYGEIEQLSDVNRSSVNELAMNRWEWSAMGSEVTGTEEVVERVMRSGLSGSKQQRLLGWLLMTAAGRECPMGSRQAKEYRRYARQLGIALSSDVFGAGAFSARLDWESGTEVLRAA